MVTSRSIRPKKTTLNNYIETTISKDTTRTKIIKTLKNHKKGLPLMELSIDAGVRSSGNLHETLRRMIISNEIIKSKCPHCSTTILYKLR